MKSGQEAKQTGEHAAKELKHKGEQVTDQIQERAQEAGDQAKGKLRQEMDQRSQQLAEQIDSTAEGMRKAGEELRKQGKDQPAQLFSRGAEKVERLGQYLKESDAERMLHDVEEMARKKPPVAVASGAVLGFAFSRFLKVSSRRRNEASGGQKQTQAQAHPQPETPSVPPAVTVPPEPALPPASPAKAQPRQATTSRA